MFYLITTSIHGSKNARYSFSLSIEQELYLNNIHIHCQKNLTSISVLTHLDTFPKSYLSSLIPTVRERERAKKALNYKGFSKPKLRLGCSNIQHPKPFDLRLTSSKALIYY